MRRLLTTLAVATAAVMIVPVAVAEAPVLVTGGGTGTVLADLDGDGDIDGSHFGVGVSFAGGSPRGTFMCQMAGNADILGLPLMAVSGNVTGGSVDATAGTATLTGTATVNLGNAGRFRDVPYSVELSAGGPGVGGLELTVVGAFDGVPGDTVVGNGNYDLPPETVATGRISIR
jgi:hypothetical protein